MLLRQVERDIGIDQTAAGAPATTGPLRQVDKPIIYPDTGLPKAE